MRKPDLVELTCWGPAEVAVARAEEHGVRVVGWTHGQGGLVSLLADSGSLDVDSLLAWYDECASWPHPYPGRLVAFTL